MRTVQASEAKTHFSRLLDAVEQGETIQITRHGQIIATLAPGTTTDSAALDEAREWFRGLRKRAGKVNLAEIQSAIREGRK
ncbi:MAG TPA: type II toxin-antitoxin system prevent-host-death family antitoxin [Bryobacteraceae bacterium]|nr:prevent-host-death family protein [Bryobacterales bacterium]HRJ19687.1 type II toxin-antitoxin system prevent-host-death family antitoxin [Bryobacteraceae bacterium]